MSDATPEYDARGEAPLETMPTAGFESVGDIVVHKAAVYKPLIWDSNKGIEKISLALACAQGSFEPVLLDKEGKIIFTRKNGSDGSYSYKYSSLGAIIKSVGPALSDCEIARVAGVKQDGEKIVISTMLIHSSGQWLGCELVFIVKSEDPKKIGSAISYGRRYGLSALCGIASEEDDDGDAAGQTTGTPTKHTAPDRGRGEVKANAAQKAKALKLVSEVTSYDGYEHTCNVLSDTFPKAVLQDQELRAKLSATSRIVAASDLTECANQKDLDLAMKRYPKSVQEADNVVGVYNAQGETFKQDSVENENQDNKRDDERAKDEVDF